MLRARTSEWGGAWLPIFSEAAVRKGSEVYWPIAVSETSRQLTCIVCPGGDQPWPQVRIHQALVWHDALLRVQHLIDHP